MCSKYHCMCINIIAIITIRSLSVDIRIEGVVVRVSSSHCRRGPDLWLRPFPGSVPFWHSLTHCILWAVSPVPVISRQTTWKSEVVKLIVNFRRNAYLKLRGGSNSNEVCLATEKMDRKNNTVENISKNFSQTLDSVLTMANITNRQKDSWSLKKSFNDLFYWTYILIS